MNNIRISNNPHIKSNLPSPSIKPMEIASLPGIFTLITAPFDLIYAGFIYFKAISIGDKEAELEASHRLTSLPINIMGSLASGATFLYQVGTYLKNAKNAILKLNIPAGVISKLNIMGFALGLIESVVEICAIKRIKKQLDSFHLNTEGKISAYLHENDPAKKRKLLSNALNTLLQNTDLTISTSIRDNLEEIRRNVENSIEPSNETLHLIEKTFHKASKELILADAEEIQKNHLSISSSLHDKIKKVVIKRLGSNHSKRTIARAVAKEEKKILQVKINDLARRVTPLSAEEMKDHLNPLLHLAKYGSRKEQREATKEIKQLLTTAKIQAKKSLITHIVALCVFAASTAASIVLIVGVPPAIPTVILLNLGLISTINYLCNRGTIKQKGWKFSAYDALPSPIQWICSKTQKLYRSALGVK